MAAYNAERTVAAAVRSILWQTLVDLELIVVDDCSTDDTHEVLRALAAEDSRLRVIRNARRRERSCSRNRAIQASCAELIAVLDADDLALPERLELQATFLERSPDVTLLGGWGYEMDAQTGILSPYSPPPADNDAILAGMRRCNPFIHSSVMFRKEAAVRAGLYDPVTTSSEDSDLFWRLLRDGTAHILPDPLVLIRMDWGRERRVSRLRRTEDLRTRRRGMRRRREITMRDWLSLLPGVLRLAVPSAVDVRLRRLKRRLRKPPSACGIREWIRACETGERQLPTSPAGFVVR
ncbi:MAG: glycosyltransferase family 2 protein [Gemmatimonadetes bacterium]|nr:glycosyltransferase family 2 protein [Gemmatimonadota bacterium]